MKLLTSFGFLMVALMPVALATLFKRRPHQKNLNELNLKRPLPTGSTEFDEWSDRIISGTLLPATPESQKFALAEMIMHMKPTEDHECDAYFIKCLRKSAANQVAHAKMISIRDAAKARLAAEEEAKKASETPMPSQDNVVSLSQT